MKIPALLFALTLASVAFAADTSRPNFVFINIDDLGYAEIGPFSGRNKTPELDRMAREGRKLTSFYAAPVCTPSRASLMTGCYHKRVMPIQHVLFPVAQLGLNPEERTVAEVLKDAGYTTAMIGKWHLGDQPAFLPTKQGFERYYGLPYSNDMGPAGDGIKSDLGKPIPQPKAANAKKKAVDDETGVRGTQPPLAVIENDAVVGRVLVEDQIQLAKRYTDRAVAFIKEKHTKPFFLYLAHNAVHFPRYPRPEFVGKSGHGLLGDWVQEIDWSVGQVLAALRETRLDRNTLVIFTSDNGGPTYQEAVNTPLRGAKGTTLEGGIRVPTIAWWPGKISAGTSTDAIAGMLDVLPTFAALAGARLPAGRKLDGVDQTPILLGNPAKAPRDTFFYYRGLLLEAVRSGAWKLHLEKGELYDLRTDLGEANNVAAAHADEVKRLRALAETMRNDLGWEGVGPGCRAIGRVEHPQPLISLEGKVRADMAGKVKTLP